MYIVWMISVLTTVLLITNMSQERPQSSLHIAVIDIILHSNMFMVMRENCQRYPKPYELFEVPSMSFKALRLQKSFSIGKQNDSFGHLFGKGSIYS